jgi:two-component system, sensor histidine kinase PdtaS
MLTEELTREGEAAASVWTQPDLRDVAVPIDGGAGDLRERLLQERLMRDESDHRLGNFLQLIVANLDRAARGAADPVAQAAINAAAGQVQALGTLHHALAGSYGGDQVDCEANLRDICRTLEAFVLAPRGHRLRFSAQSRVAGAAPCAEQIRCLGTLVSELVINAGKHAFPAGAAGEVDVVLSLLPETVSCTVRDNGVGPAASGVLGGSRGMPLAQRLAEQAGGQCRWVFSACGTEARIDLPLGARPAASAVRAARSFRFRMPWLSAVTAAMGRMTPNLPVR